MARETQVVSPLQIVTAWIFEDYEEFIDREEQKRLGNESDTPFIVDAP